MNKQKIESKINDFFKNSKMNTVDPSVALSRESAGITIFSQPITGYASADNEYLNKLKSVPEANLRLEPPKYWLPEARTVISFFLPFSATVCESNLGDGGPSAEWLHGRIEGQLFINALLKELRSFLDSHGYKTVIPMFSERFWAKMGRACREDEYGSNWSERHVAYAAGLGTFSLTRNLITQKGVAGRFGSLITEAKVEPTVPKYNGLYENCTMCGACVKRCPVNAISLKGGKLQKLCSDFLDDVKDENDPYYGCGKCQVGVPCQSQIPLPSMSRH